MARHWRDDENRNDGGNQRPFYGEQNEQRGWRGEGGGWQGRGDEDYERWGRGQGGGPGGEQSGGSDYGADYGGGNPDRNMPYSHGGYGHRQSRGLGGSGQGGSGQGGYQAGGYQAGGYGYERDWQRDPAEHGRQYGARDYGQEYDQRGSRWGQFGGGGRGDPGEETWGPRSQRSLGHWREQYGSGEDYGRGGGPAGQMDTGHGDYGRDMRGPHRGKGPKGYQRSPERLKEDICERLSDAHDVDASEISISCKDGVVTLEGSVESRQMKHRAEDIVESCSGVKDVENRLKVQSQQAGQSAAGQTGGQASGQSGTSNQNRLSTGGPLHH